MIQLRAINIHRNNKGAPYAYTLMDTEGKTYTLGKDELKKMIIDNKNKVSITNLKLLSNNRLIEKRPKNEGEYGLQERKFKEALIKLLGMSSFRKSRIQLDTWVKEAEGWRFIGFLPTRFELLIKYKGLEVYIPNTVYPYPASNYMGSVVTLDLLPESVEAAYLTVQEIAARFSCTGIDTGTIYIRNGRRTGVQI